MNILHRFFQFVDVNLIYCLIPMTLTLLLIEVFFPTRFQTKKALQVIRWIILLYTGLNLIYIILGSLVQPEKFTFIDTDRATGRYALAYWIILLSATILPFTLLLKKLGSKFWYVLLVAFAMKAGAYFERIVLISTQVHRDYPAEASFETSYPVLYGVILTTVQGILLVLLILWATGWYTRKKAPSLAA